MDLGLVTFADLHPGLSPAERMRDLLEEARLADELGLKVFAVGEHHRPDYLVSSPTTVLAAIAAVTKQIRLSSAVSVLSSDDPVRVFEQFAHVDLISGGRAEIMAGRGSFIESFPLFGYDLGDYDELFTEKLELLLAIRDNERVTWQGKHRAPLDDAVVWPRPVQDRLPIWVAVGGSPESVVRAASFGLPLALAIIGGQTARFKPFVDLYRHAWEETGQVGEPRIAINTHAFVADSRRTGRRSLLRAIPGRDEPDRPRTRLAALGTRRSSRHSQLRPARSHSARPRRSPRRSSRSTRPSSPSATSPTSASAPSHTPTSCAQSSSSERRWRRSSSPRRELRPRLRRSPSRAEEADEAAGAG